MDTYFTPQLWNPLETSFIMSIFILWLFLMIFIYFLPSFFSLYKDRYNHVMIVKDIIFSSLFSVIYIYWLSNEWVGIHALNSSDLYFWIGILFMVFGITYILKYKYLPKTLIWIFQSFLIWFTLLILVNLLFQWINTYFFL